MGYKVKGCSGPIWHSMEPQVPLMHNKLEDALLTVTQVCEIIYEVVSVWNKEALYVMTSVILVLLLLLQVLVFRYDAVNLGGFGFPEEKPDPVIDPFVQWRMSNVVIPPQALQGALNNERGDKVEGAKAIRLRMKFVVYKLTTSTSQSVSSEETIDDKPVQKKYKPANKGKSASKKRPVEEPDEEVHTRKKKPAA